MKNKKKERLKLKEVKMFQELMVTLMLMQEMNNLIMKQEKEDNIQIIPLFLFKKLIIIYL